MDANDFDEAMNVIPFRFENLSLDVMKDANGLELLLRERLENGGGSSWKIGESSLGGRGIFATTDLHPGDRIFVDKPIVIGPRGGMEGAALCVQCFHPAFPLKKCDRGCRLPICGPSCQETHCFTPECDLLQQLGVKDGDSWNPDIYRALTPFRCLFLPERDREIIKRLQARAPEELAPEVKILKRALTSPLPDEDEKWMDYCCRVMDAVAFQASTNDFEHRYSSIRGLYPLAGLMNHSCIPNARQVYDSNQNLNLIAVKDISYGDEVTTSYCPVLWATPIRMQFLYKTKNFSCTCARCKDPTEFGTYLSGLKCCAAGMMIPIRPLNPRSEWKCDTCLKSLNAGQAFVITTLLATQPDRIKSFTPTLNNHMILEKNINKLFLQRRNLQGLSTKELNERDFIIRGILKIIEKLQLGDCRIKGLLLFELHNTLNEKNSRILNTNLEDKSGLIKIAKKILEDDAFIPSDIKVALSKSDS